MRRLLGFCLLSSLFVFISDVYAAVPIHPWYVSLNAGVFQGNFDVQYNDLVDAIPLNIRQPVQQYGYSGGFGVGYNTIWCNQYLFAGQLDANFYTYHAAFASGASTTAFTDTLAIERNVDLTFVPGIFISESTAFYAKAGISYAHVTSSVSSPAGFAPVYVRTSSSDNTFGVALGLGAKRWINLHTSIFAEYLFHDYGSINFSNFQNFSTTYNHSTRLNTQNILVGVNYFF